MAMPSFAFSVHNFISSTGADAGFAAIVGLAILVLLYFAHARETANLREEAALLTQRLHHAEARVAELTRMQSAAVAAPPEAQQALANFHAPAGMAAPALGSATHVVPIALEAPEPEEPIVVRRPAAAPAPAVAMAGVAAPPSAAPRGPAAAPAPMPPRPAQPVPAPVARSQQAVPAAAPRSPAAFPAPATTAGGNGRSAGGGSPPPAAPSIAQRQPGSRPAPQLKLPPPRRRRSRVGRGVAVAVGAIAVVAIAVLLFALTSVGGSNSPSPHGQTTNAPSGSHVAGAATFKPSTVTVAVLNGTSVYQLAHRIGAKLVADGYKEGALATATSQTETATTVAYLPGRANRVAALHVAAALRLHPAAVQPVDQSTLQVACPGPSACTANVIVTVGTDLSNQ